ncbi:MAG TPA: glycosyltransferase family 4 protein [Gaiellaceae bacterium]|nr:glycosyltransferase family 4 protein [Gaiellaceae bacterium]
MKLAVVTSGFPRRSETFVLNELLALDAAGVLGRIFALKPGDGSPLQPGARRLLPRVAYVPAARTQVRAALVADALRDQSIAGVHAYFAHEPAEVAAAAAALLRVPYSFSAHALDVRKVATASLHARAAAARCVIACNADVAGELDAAGAAPQLLPHGVDLARFRPQPEPVDDMPTLLAVGRLVPKKGFDVLIDAAARLRRPFRLRIVGDGPERDALAARIGSIGLASRVSLESPLTHAELPAAYAAANVVVVPSVLDSAGDRDGLPNVVLEALAVKRAVVASDIAAIGTAIQHGRTGVLATPGDAEGLATALERLLSDRDGRGRLAAAGCRLVEREFDLGRCTDRLVGFLEGAYA